jgi:hypothetical protein
MADISKLSRLVGGIQRQVDLSTNTLVVDALKVGGGAGTDLTKTILDKLINLQNGTDFANGTNAHTHDGRYFTETELGSSGASSGSDLIGDDNTYSNFTPAAATVKGALSGIDSALATAGGTSFSDAVFEIYDNGDATKKIVFQASGIATATTRTISLTQNANLDLIATAVQRDGSVAFTANQPMGGFKLTGLAAGSGAGDSVRYEQAILASGANAWAANQSLGGFKITNAADGTSAQDYVTKAQLDAVAAGLDPKASVRAATTAALPAVTYNNGASGVGATLTANANGALAAQDGITLIVGNRFLVKNQSAALQNGIYTVTDVGSAGTPFILTRSTDQDGSPASEVSGGNFTFVEAGTDQAGSGWTVLWDGNVVVGTDAVNWTQFSDKGIAGGDMITVTGNSVAVDLATTSGLESSNPGNAAGQLRVKLEASNPSLRITGSNELAAKLDAAGAILSGASGLAVQTDNSSIEINANALRVKAAGITESHLAASVAGAGLTGGAGSPLAVGAGDGITVNANDVAVNATALSGTGIENDGSNNFRIAAAAYDQSTITGGAGSAAAVQNAPKIQEAKVAGEAFAATTLFAVRYAKAADAGFVAGRMYKAAIDASAADNFYVIGLTRPASLLAAGDPMTVVKHGTINVPSHGFTVGAPLFLSAAGAVTATAPTGVDEAVVRVGIVIDSSNIDVQIQVTGIN